MKEPYVEGLAAHDDPELCVVTREGAGEALTGALASWVLSREKLKLQGADAVARNRATSDLPQHAMAALNIKGDAFHPK